ncbi:MAG: PqqD family protein [Acidimicrobiales bacterium]
MTIPLTNEEATRPGTLLWSRAGDALWRRVGDTVVLLAAGAEEPMVVSGSAGPIWDLLARPISLPEIARRLAAEYGVAEETIVEDVGVLLGRLAEAGAVRASGAAPGAEAGSESEVTQGSGGRA